MRLRRLTLERFGRFEGCELTFRPGAPDLHVIYGANEAGKTTSMAAVSDLLFGFEVRSRYNFRFDYPLLRIGAELEEDGRILSIRRRKANAGSLVDEDDRPIDEGPLAAMLHGLTRDRFRLAFSLDHLRLREGGRAIVQAKDDVGQALFAAGSGMTDVVDALAALEAEADAIWAPRAAKHRTFTQAERSHDASRAAARDLQVRPKAWSDARGAHEDAETRRRDAELERDGLVAEQGRLERLRRIAPAMRRRADLLDELAKDTEVRAMPAAREERVVAALAAIAEAERLRTAAAALLAEADERLAAVPEDAPAMTAAAAIDELVERRGAVLKAEGDAVRIGVERRAKVARLEELRADLGLGDRALPPRSAVTRLRELARRHAEATAGLRAVAETEEDVRSRLGPLERRLADAVLTEDLPALVAAVDAARRLGDDVDARQAAAADAARAGADAAVRQLARLAPWTGTASELERLPGVHEHEIAVAEADLTRLSEAVRAAADEAARAGDDVERISLDRGALAGQGQAVSTADLADARGRREALWTELRDAILGAARLADPAGSERTYQSRVAEADDVADRRFAFAADSGRLALLDRQADEAALRGSQAARRRDEAVAAEAARLAAWFGRLKEIGVPPMDPGRLRGWLADRVLALEAAQVADRLGRQAEAEAARRQAGRAALLRLMPGPGGDDELLAPLLIEAERRRAEGEARDQAYRQDHAEVRQLSEALAAQGRLGRRQAEEIQRIEGEWRDLQAATGTATSITEGDAPLSLIDDLRVGANAVEALDARLAGIVTDARRFETDLAALWRSLDGEGEASLDRLRTRLETARSSANLRADLQAECDRRTGEMERAAAARDAAVTGLRPVVDDLGGVGIEELDGAVQASRRVRGSQEALAAALAEITAAGDGLPIETLEEQWRGADPDLAATRAGALPSLLAESNARVTAAAEAAREAKLAFEALDLDGDGAAEAAAEAEQARAEMAVQAETYLLKRAQAVTLRWAIERHRRERQDPLLARAGTLFRRLTLGRYSDLRIDHDAAVPRLLGVADGGRSAIDVDAMSDGTADQLFLALRLAAAEQSVASGVRLPFLADDLFINFDDDRAKAGFEVLAELATSTQVLFFTHHAHLADLARGVVGAELHSRCDLDQPAA
jgi:uncharacterized protein YhaN